MFGNWFGEWFRNWFGGQGEAEQPTDTLVLGSIDISPLAEATVTVLQAIDADEPDFYIEGTP